MAELNLEYDTETPVMVTGATGYVAGWLVKRLLEEGFKVHAAVRDPSNKDKIAHLNAMAEESEGTIEFFKADLLKDGSYEKAMADCNVVFHTASPFKSRVKDPQKDLVDPALKGTENVLNSVKKTKSVKRVVLTSSVAAIYGVPEDIEKAPNEILTEEVWNTSSSLEVTPYNYSKTLAEKAAWKIAKGQKSWDMVAINPALVFGPGTAKTQTSESFNVIKAMVGGRMAEGAPNVRIGAVDVRDVAEAHFRAAFIPSAEGRHIVFGQSCSFLEIADMLRENYGKKWPLPEVEAPGDIIPWRADNRKSQEKLGMLYGGVDVAVNDMVAQMIADGTLTKPEASPKKKK